MSARLDMVYLEAMRLEPAMREMVPWDTGGSRLFLWLSAALVLVSVAMAAVKATGWLVRGAAAFIAPERFG